MSGFSIAVRSASPKKTHQIGTEIGKRLFAGAILCLRGELGSGKTVFVQGLAQGLGIDPKEVRSPTFAIIQEHHGRISLCHVDIYRLALPEIEDLGLEEYWKVDSLNEPELKWVVAIEWSEKVQGLIPHNSEETIVLNVRFNVLPKGEREILFQGHKKWKEVLSVFKEKSALRLSSQ